MMLSKKLIIVYVGRFLSGFNGVTWTILGPILILEIIPPKY